MIGEARLILKMYSTGRSLCFRDQPLRYLVVEIDPETGQVQPEIRDGRPRILHLCREEREAR